MSARRFFDRSDHDAAREAPPEAAPAPADETARLLALQRTAGNAAVARMIAQTTRTLARQDDDSELTPYTVEGNTQDDGDSSSEGEEQEVADPLTTLGAAVTARVQETGQARDPALAERPPVPYTPYDNQPAQNPLRGEQPLLPYTADDDEPADNGLIPYAADGGGGTAADATVSEDDATQISADDATEISEDLPSGGAPASQGRDPHLYDEQAEGRHDLYEQADGRHHLYDEDVPPPDYIPEPPPVAYADVPAKKKKGRIKRALAAAGKPFKAVGSAVKGLGKRLKGKKKGPKTKAEDIVYAPDDTVYGEEVLHAAPKPVVVEPEEITISEDLPAPKPTKYGDLASMGTFHQGEQASSEKFVNNTLLAAHTLFEDMKRAGFAQASETAKAVMADRARVREGLQRVWGWSKEDISTYYDFKKNKVKNTKVEYITSEADLQKYVVHAGASLTFGDPPRSFDTAGMVSKASGPGFAIFVMDDQGNIYAGQHRVGLFHHSSFLASRQVAAAGELKVTGGTLVELTAKSGHYQPSPEQTRQVLRELADAGVPLAGVKVKLWIGKNADTTKLVDAADFLARGSAADMQDAGGRFG